MGAPVTREHQQLEPAARAFRQIVREAGGTGEARFQVLEAMAARLGSHDLRELHRLSSATPLLNVAKLDDAAKRLLEFIESSDLEPALAVSALAREDLTTSAKKATGAYHTDYRLARRLARSVAPGLSEASRVIDPACGAGMLLAALTLEVCGRDRKRTAEWLRQSVCAADLSDGPLRGALITLACLTNDVSALRTMRARWFAGDSLLAGAEVWATMAPEGFDAIVANPPWEKVKLSRHEYLQAEGHARHYGAAIDLLNEQDYTDRREAVASYGQRLASRYPVLLRGEPDLYAAFMALYLGLLRPGGQAAVLVPGGLIRSQGTEALRRAMFKRCSKVKLAIFDNRARFFSIDTRFKFLAVGMTRAAEGSSARSPISLTHETGTPDGTMVTGRARLGRRSLAAVRPDLSVPEVQSEAAWSLFSRLTAHGERLDDPKSSWWADFCREVDMTNDRPHFVSRASRGTVPVIEGRHIQQHRVGAKQFQSGSGRAAIWQPTKLGQAKIVAQFHMPTAACSAKASFRLGQLRAGFCDIAGQTNERAMMAALIPPGVVCGNKVPTVMFPNDPSADRLRVWLAIANSLTFDWMLRRILTTTINYFVLLSLPMPCLTPGGLPWRRMAQMAEDLAQIDRAGRTPETDRRAGAIRTLLEVEVARAYGIETMDLALMAQDFPLLDRGQPALPGEPRSTVTFDSVLAAMAGRSRSARSAEWQQRKLAAQALGAVPFIPAQHVSATDSEEIDAHGNQHRG